MPRRGPSPARCSPAAIDDADPDAGAATEILEGIPGLARRLDRAEAEAAAGKVVELRDL